eukprot:TRINITY_DN67287_c2_g1_i1.p1 TRINITY_DN67287_c2_g1~~TRINITY_DN67287_c2_g1_i1.p1  ORF type:complete len:616 (+),score=385.70 TRINITY_DN67287_c2_g1_i1:50-1849(+)
MSTTNSYAPGALSAFLGGEAKVSDEAEVVTAGGALFEARAEIERKRQEYLKRKETKKKDKNKTNKDKKKDKKKKKKKDKGTKRKREPSVSSDDEDEEEEEVVEEKVTAEERDEAAKLEAELSEQARESMYSGLHSSDSESDLPDDDNENDDDDDDEEEEEEEEDDDSDSDSNENNEDDSDDDDEVDTAIDDANKKALGLSGPAAGSDSESSDDDDGEEDDDDEDDKEQDTESKNEDSNKNDKKSKKKNKNKTDKEKKRENKQQQRRDRDKTVFVGNVPNTMTTSELCKLFADAGPIASVRFRSIAFADASLPRKAAFIKRRFHESRDTMNAYVVFKTAEAAKKALDWHNRVVGGKHIRVDMADPSLSRMKEMDASKSVFLGNLPFTVTEEQIRQHFAECGSIYNVRLIRDRITNIGKGIGYLTFDDAESVRKALSFHNTKANFSNDPDPKRARELRVFRCLNKDQRQRRAERRQNMERNVSGLGKKRQNRTSYMRRIAVKPEEQRLAERKAKKAMRKALRSQQNKEQRRSKKQPRAVKQRMQAKVKVHAVPTSFEGMRGDRKTFLKKLNVKAKAIKHKKKRQKTTGAGSSKKTTNSKKK